jgi:hypothetical protein
MGDSLRGWRLRNSSWMAWRRVGVLLRREELERACVQYSSDLRTLVLGPETEPREKLPPGGFECEPAQGATYAWSRRANNYRLYRVLPRVPLVDLAEPVGGSNGSVENSTTNHAGFCAAASRTARRASGARSPACHSKPLPSEDGVEEHEVRLDLIGEVERGTAPIRGDGLEAAAAEQGSWALRLRRFLRWHARYVGEVSGVELDEGPALRGSQAGSAETLLQPVVTIDSARHTVR